MGAKSTRVYVTLEPELKEQVEALAQATGVSTASFIRMLCMSAVTSVGSAFAALGTSLAESQGKGSDDES